MHLTRRAATSNDTDFARRTHHAAYREVVERQFGVWNEKQQDRFFADAWETTPHEILLADGVPVGYCSVEEGAGDIHLRELLLDPSYQGRGIGTAFVQQLQADAARDAKPIRLGTFHQNRARELYERLGFLQIETTSTHVLMEWHPRR